MVLMKILISFLPVKLDMVEPIILVCSSIHVDGNAECSTYQKNGLTKTFRFETTRQNPINYK